MSLESKIKDLFMEARSSGRKDVITALFPFIHIPEICYELTEDSVLDEDIVFVLTREQYDHQDINAMCSAKMLKISGYTDFLKSLMAKMDQPTRNEVAWNVFMSGQGNLLKDTMALWDPQFITDKIDKLVASMPEQFTSYIPHPSEWDRDMMHVFNALNIDMPSDFSDLAEKNYTGYRKDGVWNENRMLSNDNWVGEICEAHGIPEVVMNDGMMTIANAMMPTAFLQERERTLDLGDWHNDNFPGYFPVIADTDTAASMVEQSYAVAIKPTFLKETPAGTIVDHSFALTDENQGISDFEIKKAISLLSNKQITDIRGLKKGKEILLVPYNIGSMIPLQACSIPRELDIAIRYHRPEYLKMTGKYDYISGNYHLVTQMYLRGVPLNSDFDIYLGKNLLMRPDLIPMLNSKEEHQFIIQRFTPDGRQRTNQDDYSLLLSQTDADPDESALKLRKGLDLFIKTFGIEPNLVLRGDHHFLKACVDQKCYTGLDSRAYTQKHQSHHSKRLAATFGTLYGDAEKLEDKSISGLIKAGVRIKDTSASEMILGMLDRYDVKEVAQTAATPAQAVYVHDNFDQAVVFENLAPKLQKGIKRKKLENDLGI